MPYKKRKLFHLTDTNYCGIQNNENLPPNNELDAICKEHDESKYYKDWKGYVFFNEDDQKVIDKAAGIGGSDALIVRSFFKAKKFLMPHAKPLPNNKHAGYITRTFRKRRAKRAFHFPRLKSKIRRFRKHRTVIKKMAGYRRRRYGYGRRRRRFQRYVRRRRPYTIKRRRYRFSKMANLIAQPTRKCVIEANSAHSWAAARQVIFAMGVLATKAEFGATWTDTFGAAAERVVDNPMLSTQKAFARWQESIHITNLNDHPIFVEYRWCTPRVDIYTETTEASLDMNTQEIFMHDVYESIVRNYTPTDHGAYFDAFQRGNDEITTQMMHFKPTFDKYLKKKWSIGKAKSGWLKPAQLLKIRYHTKKFKLIDAADIMEDMKVGDATVTKQAIAYKTAFLLMRVHGAMGSDVTTFQNTGQYMSGTLHAYFIKTFYWKQGIKLTGGVAVNYQNVIPAEMDLEAPSEFDEQKDQ